MTLMEQTGCSSPFRACRSSRDDQRGGRCDRQLAVTLLLARDVGQVRDVLRQSDTTDDAGSRRVFATVEEAVEAATTLRSGNTSQTNTQETP
jgi:hypothetical protein